MEFVDSFFVTQAATMDDSGIQFGRGPGMVLTSRPREASSRVMLDELIFLLRYPLHSGQSLLGERAELLPLRCCKRRFGG